MFCFKMKYLLLRSTPQIIPAVKYLDRYLYHSHLKLHNQKSPSKLLCTVQSRQKCNNPEIDKQSSYISYSEEKPINDQTIGKLLEEAVEKWPNSECIVSYHQNIRLTYSDVLLRADKFAAGLKKLGLKKGDRIGIFGPNDIEWFITFLSATRLGLIVVAINSAFQRDELIYCLNKVQVKAIVSPVKYKNNYIENILGAKQFCPNLEHVIVWSGDHITGTRRWLDIESLSNKIEVEAVSAEQGNISSYDACNIQFTSGSTGKPKAVLLSHRSLVNNAERGVARAEIKFGYKGCLNVPLFHAFGLVFGQINTLLSGCTIILESPSFNAIKSLEVMAKEKCDITYGTPTMWINMIDLQQQLRLSIRPHLGIIGGSSISSELFRRIKDVLGISNMKTIYGLTEFTCISFQSLPGEDRTLTENTIGHVLDNTEVMVVDSNDKPVPFGSPGELWMRGYSSMIGYYNDPENTKKTLTEDGWLKSGDRFILYPNGYGQIVGRIKDIIIRGGENIFPKEIEDFLLNHPSIAEVYCLGAYDAIYGEEVCACIRLFENRSLNKEELQTYCRGKIAHFKIPKYIIFLEKYPKTASGKIQKNKLKEELESKGIIPSTPKCT